MRRGLVLTVALALAFGIGAPAGADPPTTEVSDFTVIQCGLSGEPGEGFVFVEAGDDFTFADAVVWLPGSDPSQDEPDLFSAFDAAEVSLAGNAITATIPMVSGESEEPAGVITLDGSIGALLDEESFSERFREGNRWVRIEETVRIFEASAAVALDGVPFVAECSANEVHSEFSSTNPHAFRIDFQDAFVECFGMAGSDGSTLNLFAGEFEEGAFLDLQIFPPNGNGNGNGNGENGDHEDVPEFFGFADIPQLSGTIEVTVPLFDPFDGSGPVDEAHVVLSITEGEVFDSDIVFQNGRVKVTEAELTVGGSVDLAVDGRHFDLEGCFGRRFEARGIITNPSGPKMSGRAPVNDVPAGALDLAPGDRINQQTKATEQQPEAPCFANGEENGEFFFDPIGKTVWYSIEGTGGPVTVSTAGSHFDTMLGVYQTNGSGLELVDCVDDVFNGGFSLQAEATWDTEEGVTYLVQIGGWGLFEDPEFPEFSSTAEYGLLKVSVSG